ncbi:MAG: hypothetical protein DHS20C15_10340 [Planctomycetota bacterium]|nr:MAG: hypothetical protein DHS20C15_10340 [Planctomycetota bacterium]
MTLPNWQQLGFLNPDAYSAQRELWALHAQLLRSSAEIFAALAECSAEPSWAASLVEAGERHSALASELRLEAGEDAQISAQEDSQLSELRAVFEEVLVSGHVPSLLVTGAGPLGGYPRLVVELLGEVAGPHASALCVRMLEHSDHELLARLFAMSPPTPADQDALRRLLRHLHGKLAALFGARRQELHCLGVDGEVFSEKGAERVRELHHALGLKVTRADLAAGRLPG